jgi:glycosyltransferase involved in cell wall biosynthesis
VSDKKYEVDVTILMPCLNEASSLGLCLETAREALHRLAEKNLTGEILISDNGSTDGSQEIARDGGARVTQCPARGYGNALMHGCREARGKFIVMGDADASYDFREAVPMIDRLREGYELCMGNRFAGGIEPGAMPWKNRYIGNPVLSGILNLFYRSGLGDAHCGLRAFTRAFFDRMHLTSTGMEFASEMVVKAALRNTRRTEVPITLHKDKRNRPPHLQPWRDGWRHLRFLLLLSPLWLYIIPGVLMVVFSLAIFTALLLTPPGEVFRIGPIWFGDHWVILAGGILGAGYSALILGAFTFFYSLWRHYRVMTRFRLRVAQSLTVENALALGFLFCLIGVLFLVNVVVTWTEVDYHNLAKIREMTVATAFFAMGLKTAFWGFLFSFVCDQAELPGVEESPEGV